MAKKKSIRIAIRMVSPDGKFFYVTFKNSRKTTGKLQLKKYNPRTRTHELFTEAKIK